MNRVAIIGTGISGLGAAFLLHKDYDITVYEKNADLGGHTRTRRIFHTDRIFDVDTGFIVFNKKNYPNLTALFDHLNVPIQKSVMSFGVTAPKDNLEWGAETLSSVFGQRRNLLRRAFYKFLFDILKFNRRAKKLVSEHPLMTMQDLINRLNLGKWFAEFYLLPMGGAIWSLSLSSILAFPAKAFIDFFDAHGLLTVTQQPQWYTVTGGSIEYVKRLIWPFKDHIKKSCGVTGVIRGNGKVQITDVEGETNDFDQVIFACHGDEALALLQDANETEKKVLSCFRYQENNIVLHKNCGVMPRRRACWASWVYHADGKSSDAPVSVTYWMNHLQNLASSRPIFVTLNPRVPVPEADVFERHSFTHPIYDEAAIAAQVELAKLQGVNNTWFCGAYHRNGFHEDGLVSAINVAAQMGVGVPWT